MNRVERMDIFIKRFANVQKEYPEMNIQATDIYASLVKLDVYNREIHPLEPLFNNWIQFFQGVPNIKAFVSERHKYFCQFVNGVPENFTTQVKMYVPLDKDHIEKGAKDIFSFMAQRGIKHQSKIGKDIRNDNVVIRVYNIDDAKVIEEYIQSNEYIKGSTIPLNPFSIESNGVAYALDGEYSYNSEVSKHIYDYVNNLKNNNNLNQAGISSFREFLINRYNSTFVNGTGLKDFINNRDILGSREEISNKLLNYKSILALIYEASFLEANIETVKYRYGVINDNSKRQSDRLHMYKLLDWIEAKDEKQNEGKANDDAKKMILDMAIYETYKKYGRGQAEEAIKNYIHTGRATYFTRENDARNILLATVSPNDTSKTVTNEATGQIDIKAYVSNLIIYQTETNIAR